MRILHTMLRVGDLERSIAFYRDVLGMKLLSRKDYPEGKFTLAFLGYGKNPEHAEIELTHNWGADALRARHRATATSRSASTTSTARASASAPPAARSRASRGR